MLQLLYIFLAGGLGTLARYGITRGMLSILGSAYPWGTLLVNSAGCFLFGLFWTALASSHVLEGHLRTILLIGFLGGFTTFSTFAFEVSDYLRQEQWLTAGLTFVGHNTLGVLLMILGLYVGRELS